MVPTLDEAVARYARVIDAPAEEAAEELARELDHVSDSLEAASVPAADREALRRVDTPAEPSDVSLAGPWIQGRAGEQHMRVTAVPLSEAAERVGVSTSALRRVIGGTTGPGVELLGFKDSRGSWRVFTYQLPPDADGTGGEPASRTGRRVQRELPPRMHPVAVAAWWDAPNAALYLDGDELTPRGWIAGDLNPDQVIAAARHEDA